MDNFNDKLTNFLKLNKLNSNAYFFFCKDDKGKDHFHSFGPHKSRWELANEINSKITEDLKNRTIFDLFFKNGL